MKLKKIIGAGCISALAIFALASCKSKNEVEGTTSKTTDVATTTGTTVASTTSIETTTVLTTTASTTTIETTSTGDIITTSTPTDEGEEDGAVLVSIEAEYDNYHTSIADFLYTAYRKDGVITLTLEKYIGTDGFDVNIAKSYGGYDVKTIREGCFVGDFGFEKITLPEGLEVIEDFAFDIGECYVSIPNSIKSVGMGLSGLKQTSFKGSTFVGNENNPYLVLTYVDPSTTYATIFKDTRLITGDAFKENGNIRGFEIEEGNEYFTTDNTFLFDKTGETIIAYINGVNNAIATIPSNVKEISYSAFSSAHYLIGFEVEEGNTSFTAVDGVLYTTDLKTLVRYPYAYSSVDYKVLDSTKKLAPFAFSYFYKVVELNEGLEEISSYAFYKSYGTSELVLPSTVEVIGDYAFAYTDIKSTILPEGLKHLGAAAFYNTRLESITVPSGIEEIKFRAFGECDQLASVTLNEGLKNIESYAFTSALISEITIPSTVETLGDYCFSSTNLTSLEVPSSVKTIGTSAFSSTNIQTLKLNEGLEEIGDCAFEYAEIQTLTLPNSVTKIGEKAFHENEDLVDVTLSENLVSVGPDAFANTSIETKQYGNGKYLSSSTNDYFYFYGLSDDYSGESIEFNPSVKIIGCNSIDAAPSNITIPSGVRSICDYAFNGALGLSSLELPDTLVYIGESVISSTNVTTINIPEGVTSLVRTFDESLIENITIPSSVTRIEKAFGETLNGNTSIKTITVSENNTHYKSIDNILYTYDGKSLIKCGESITNSIVSLLDETEIICSYAFYMVGNLESITNTSNLYAVCKNAFAYSQISNFEFSNSIEIYEEYAFDKTNIEEVSISENVKYIDQYAFYDMSSLVTIDVNSNNKYYSSENNILYNKDKTCLIVSSVMTLDTLVSIPDTVTKICNGAFKSNKSTCNLVLPSSVTILEDEVFYGSNFNSVDLSNLEITSISTGLFMKSNVSEVTLPTSITIIGNSAFSYCSNLYELVIPEDVRSISGYAFESSGLKIITLSQSLLNINATAFYNTSVEKLTVNNGILISSSNFPTTIKTLKFSENVAKCPSHNFTGFTNLTNVYISSEVVSSSDTFASAILNTDATLYIATGLIISSTIASSYNNIGTVGGYAIYSKK